MVGSEQHSVGEGMENGVRKQISCALRIMRQVGRGRATEQEQELGIGLAWVPFDARIAPFFIFSACQMF